MLKLLRLPRPIPVVGSHLWSYGLIGYDAWLSPVKLRVRVSLGPYPVFIRALIIVFGPLSVGMVDGYKEIVSINNRKSHA